MTKCKFLLQTSSTSAIVIAIHLMLLTLCYDGMQASPVNLAAGLSSSSTQESSNDVEIFGDAHLMRDKRESFNMIDFLSHYGYMEPPEATYEGKFQSEEVVNIAIRDFQRFNGLDVTGIPDKQTLELMKKPRCGMPDIIRDPHEGYRNNNDNNNKNVNIPMAYKTFGSRWRKPVVTWKTSKFSSKLTKTQQLRALRKAFDVWEREIPLKFRYTHRKPDIDILFAEGEHGDGYKNRFRGKGGVLAHAYGPGRGIGGDTHFDDSEEWLSDDSDADKAGTDLATVAAHEFGHALGLGHSNVNSALMAPYYRKFDKLELKEDDILGITQIYGRKNPPTTRTPATTTTAIPRTSTTKPTDTTTHLPTKLTTTPTTIKSVTTANKPGIKKPWIPEFCFRKFRLDAISAGPNRRWFAFRGEFIYDVGPSGLAFGFPKPIRHVFPGAPVKNVRAVTYVPETRRTYIFKYFYVWRFTDFSLDEGYPRIWTNNYRFLPSAALTLTYNGISQIYMFGHSSFWEFNHLTEQVTPGYPLPLATYFPYAPMLPDAAMTNTQGNFIFFKYNKFKNLPSRGSNARLQPIGPNIFGSVCGETPQANNLWHIFEVDEVPVYQSNTKLESRNSFVESYPQIEGYGKNDYSFERESDDNNRRGRWYRRRRGHRRNVNWHLGRRFNYRGRSRESYRRG